MAQEPALTITIQIGRRSGEMCRSPAASRAGDQDRCIDKNVTINGQSTQKADQNTSRLRLLYPLFTRKSEG
jgi:hypothetical protein